MGQYIECRVYIFTSESLEYILHKSEKYILIVPKVQNTCYLRVGTNAPSMHSTEHMLSGIENTYYIIVENIHSI